MLFPVLVGIQSLSRVKGASLQKVILCGFQKPGRVKRVSVCREFSGGTHHKQGKEDIFAGNEGSSIGYQSSSRTREVSTQKIDMLWVSETELDKEALHIVA